MGEIMENKESFLKNHADTLAIIGVNLAIAAMLISMHFSDVARIDATNQRIDNTYMLIYDLLKEGKK